MKERIAKRSAGQTSKAYRDPTEAPYLHAGGSSRTLMLDLLVACLPLVLFACYRFGVRACGICLIGVASAVLSEALYAVIFRKPQTVGDLSAALIGLLLALSLPATVPLWMPVLGAFLAIVPFKMLWGGIGRYRLQPVLAARLLLALLCGKWLYPAADAVSGATPLASLKISIALEGIGPSELLLGQKSGAMGELCGALILLGAAYLILRKVIGWQTPLAFVATVAIVCFLLPYDRSGGLVKDVLLNERIAFMLSELLSGSLLFAAVYLATDYASTPVSALGRAGFGVGCGLLTVAVRYLTAYPEGVTLAILLTQLLCLLPEGYAWVLWRCKKSGKAKIREY